MKKTCAALLLLLLLVSFSPALSVDCTQYCGATPLSVYSSNVQAKQLSVAIFNPKNESVSGYIRGVVQSGGEEIYFYGEITAGANGVSLFETTFEHPINVLSCLTVCSDPPPPEAINEGPEPVVIEFNLNQSQPGNPGGPGGEE